MIYEFALIIPRKAEGRFTHGVRARWLTFGFSPSINNQFSCKKLLKAR
jgi:hypothetical protein